MATVPPPHLQSLFIFTTLLYNSINGNSVNPSTTPPCPSFDCGNGVSIRYPFWVEKQQSEHCGYPGFALSCHDQQPIFNLSNNLYRLKNINYSKFTLTIAYSEVNDTLCPVAPHGVTLNTTSLFNYTLDDKMVRFFYNCNLYPPSLPSIGCLQYGAKRSFVFAMGAIPEFDWERYCESIVTVPVDEKVVDGLGHVVVNGFGRAMNDGFKLTWKVDSTCQSCEASGGFCGYSYGGDQKFICFCSEGKRYAKCHKGAISTTSGPNFVAIGALVFSGLLIGSTVFYLVQKKKLALQKPGFSRIPSSGK